MTIDRVVHYYPRLLLGNGGVTLAARGWIAAMQRAGVDVLAVCDPAPSHGATDLDVPIIELPRRGTRRATWTAGLHSVLRAGDVLVLHSGWVFHNHIAARVAQAQTIPYVVVPHGAYDPHLARRRRSAKRLVLRAETSLLARAAATHVFFDPEVEHVRRLSPSARTIVAPTGWDVPAEEWVGGGGYLAWLGRYDVDHKGLDLLLAALRSIEPARRPCVRLRGRDATSTRSDVAAMVRRYGLSHCVEVGGAISSAAKADFMQHADGYVHPSRWESYGIALVEHLALGVPSLVSRNAMIAPALEANGAAIVAATETCELATAVARLGRANSELGARGRDFVKRHLNWDTSVQQFFAKVGI